MEINHSDGDVDRQVVIFRLAASSYAVDIAAVREIIRPRPVTVVPQAPPHVVGVINSRSTVVPVLDLRSRCGLPPAEQGRDSRVVVVQVGQQSVGLQVDGVSEVITLPATAIEPADGLVRDAAHGRLLHGVARLEERLVMLLDLQQAIQSHDALDTDTVPAYTGAA